MEDLDYKRLLTDIMVMYPEMGISKKGLTMALGVSNSQYKRWADALDAKKPPDVNKSTRYAIASLIDDDRDARLDGIEWSISETRLLVQDLMLAARVRRELRAKLLGCDVATELSGGEAADFSEEEIDEDGGGKEGDGS